jgi:MoaA/NifB/PqqE/SkfB family radical SAM enzyme
LPGFKKIYIEITNRCNLTCPFCAQSSRAKAFMAVAAFAEVLRRIHGATRFISLHVLGEPLLHPEFGQLLALSGHQGMQVNLTTNGTLLGRHRHTLLTAPALRQINISLHGLAYLQREAAEAHLRDMIDFVQEASRRTKFYISLRLWNLGTGESQGHGGWNEHLLERLSSAFALPLLRADTLRAERGLPLAPRVFLNPEPQFAWPQLSSPDLGRQGYCRGLRDHLAILVDGTVVPCCLDAEGVLALGNIFSQSLGDILAGPRARRMHEGFGHQWLVEPLCRRCSYRLRFSTTSQA